MSITNSDIESFYTFLVHQKADAIEFDDDARWSLLCLSDVQKRMFWHVAINCIGRNMQRTRPMEIKEFFSPLGIATGVIRMSLIRLTEKRLLQREKGKLGKNGFAIISLPKVIYDSAKEIFADFKALAPKL